MSPAAPEVTVDAEGTVTGNTYDKYGSTNPVVRRLMSAFERTLDELFEQADPQSLLDVGCGEAVLTHKWAKRLGDRRVVGIDLDDPLLHAQWDERRAPNLSYRVMKAENPPSPTTSSTSRRPSRSSSTCPTPRTPSPRWRAWPAATCSSRCRASRCGAG